MKTLKELEWWNDYGEGCGIDKEDNESSLTDGTCPTIDIENLKDLAREWIKFFEKYEDCEEMPDTPEELKLAHLEKSEWIKHFFNLEHSPDVVRSTKYIKQ